MHSDTSPAAFEQPGLLWWNFTFPRHQRYFQFTADPNIKIFLKNSNVERRTQIYNFTSRLIRFQGENSWVFSSRSNKQPENLKRVFVCLSRSVPGSMTHTHSPLWFSLGGTDVQRKSLSLKFVMFQKDLVHGFSFSLTTFSTLRWQAERLMSHRCLSFMFSSFLQKKKAPPTSLSLLRSLQKLSLAIKP